MFQPCHPKKGISTICEVAAVSRRSLVGILVCGTMAGVAGMPGAAKVEADYDSYQEYFVEKIWPVVQDFYENLLKKSPKRQRDGAIGGSFGDGVFVKLKLAAECRNVTCNMAWTGPSFMTSTTSPEFHARNRTFTVAIAPIFF